MAVANSKTNLLNNIKRRKVNEFAVNINSDDAKLFLNHIANLSQDGVLNQKNVNLLTDAVKTISQGF